MIKGLHHNAYRCRDSEETRQFYEDLLGLPLCLAFEIDVTKTGRPSKVLHSFYQLGDGSFLAFFEEPDEPFDFRKQRDFDLHIALEVERSALEPMMQKGINAGIEIRGISDHGFIESIYLRDPNGYVIELTAKTSAHNTATFNREAARTALHRWQRTKPDTRAAEPDGHKPVCQQDQ